MVPQQLSSRHTVRFQDCDPLNHLNNSKYIDYFINAREDQAEAAYGLNMLHMIREEKLAWVVTKHEIVYLAPATMMETVWIESQIIDLFKKGITLEMRMFDEQKTQLKAVLWTNYVFFNLATQKPTPHPPHLWEMLQMAVLPVVQKSFMERVKFLKKESSPKL